MRRKKDDKRVLRSGNGRNQSSGRKIRRKNNRRSIPKNPPVNRRRRQKRKNSKSLILIMVIALIAFVIGAGVGVSLSLGDDNDEGPHYENVTKEMTSNLTDNQVYFDKEVDDVDFNENESSQLDVHYTYSDYSYKDY